MLEPERRGGARAIPSYHIGSTLTPFVKGEDDCLGNMSKSCLDSCLVNVVKEVVRAPCPASCYSGHTSDKNSVSCLSATPVWQQAPWSSCCNCHTTDPLDKPFTSANLSTPHLNLTSIDCPRNSSSSPSHASCPSCVASKSSALVSLFRKLLSFTGLPATVPVNGGLNTLPLMPPLTLPCLLPGSPDGVDE